MNPILIFIIAVFLWVQLQIDLDSGNPCSAFNQNAGSCTQGTEQ